MTTRTQELIEAHARARTELVEHLADEGWKPAQIAALVNVQCSAIPEPPPGDSKPVWKHALADLVGMDLF